MENWYTYKFTIVEHIAVIRSALCRLPYLRKIIRMPTLIRPTLRAVWERTLTPESEAPLRYPLRSSHVALGLCPMVWVWNEGGHTQHLYTVLIKTRFRVGMETLTLVALLSLESVWLNNSLYICYITLYCAPKCFGLKFYLRIIFFWWVIFGWFYLHVFLIKAQNILVICVHRYT